MVTKYQMVDITAENPYGLILVYKDEDDMPIGYPVDLCCGAPAGQAQLAAAQSAYYTTETNIANQEFSQAEGLFNTLSAEYTPIFNAGPNQYGFNAAENNALMTEAASGTAQDYDMAKQVLNENLAAEGGANELPSGINVKADQGLAEAGASQIAQEQQQVVQAGYAQGFQDWQDAAAGLGQAMGVFSTANQAGGIATQAGSAANQTYSAIATENNSVFSTIVGGISGVAGAIGTAQSGCPAEGSMYLMADGSEQPVENLIVGDSIMGVDDEAQTIEEIQNGVIEILRVETEDGHVARVSYIHAFVLPRGGFTVSAKCLGKTIATGTGSSKVISAEFAGFAKVFNVITNGSHTYRADGVWGMGVGEGEKQVAEEDWSAINARLARKDVAKAAQEIA